MDNSGEREQPEGANDQTANTAQLSQITPNLQPGQGQPQQQSQQKRSIMEERRNRRSIANTRKFAALASAKLNEQYFSEKECSVFCPKKDKPKGQSYYVTECRNHATC